MLYAYVLIYLLCFKFLFPSYTSLYLEGTKNVQNFFKDFCTSFLFYGFNSVFVLSAKELP